MHRAFCKTPTGRQDTTVLTAARTAGAVAVCKEVLKCLGIKMANFSQQALKPLGSYKRIFIVLQGTFSFPVCQVTVVKIERVEK